MPRNGLPLQSFKDILVWDALDNHKGEFLCLSQTRGKFLKVSQKKQEEVSAIWTLSKLEHISGAMASLSPNLLSSASSAHCRTLVPSQTLKN